MVIVVNGPALARVHFLDSNPVAMRQTDQFRVPPEDVNRGTYPPQWHFTGTFSPTTAFRRLLPVITAGRAGEEHDLPVPRRLDDGRDAGDASVTGDTGNARGIGIVVGNVEVRFQLDNWEQPVLVTGVRGATIDRAPA